jgi:hypothetical protein
MVLTATDSLAEIDEALTHLRADWVAASEAGDLDRRLRLVEELDEVLEHRAERLAVEKFSDADGAPETSPPLSPRHRPENSQQSAGGLGPRG